MSNPYKYHYVFKYRRPEIYYGAYPKGTRERRDKLPDSTILYSVFYEARKVGKRCYCDDCRRGRWE